MRTRGCIVRQAPKGENTMLGNTMIKRGVILNVPFSEKDEAKELGARWDPDLRKWFVPAGKDTRPFSRWLPEKKENN